MWYSDACLNVCMEGGGRGRCLYVLYFSMWSSEVMSVGNLTMGRSQETRYLTWPSLILTMKWSHTHTHTHIYTMHMLSGFKFQVRFMLFFKTKIFPSLSVLLAFLPSVCRSSPGCSSSNGVCHSSRNDHYHPRITGAGLHTADSHERSRGRCEAQTRGQDAEKPELGWRRGQRGEKMTAASRILFSDAVIVMSLRDAFGKDFK